MTVTLDQNSIQRLLALNDMQLRMVLRKLAADYGVDLSGFALSHEELEQLRAMLSVATPEQIEQFMQELPHIQDRMKSDPS